MFHFKENKKYLYIMVKINRNIEKFCIKCGKKLILKSKKD